MRFGGRVAVVTGAAQGIGAAVARAFSREGARVAVVDVNGRGAARLAADLGGETLALTADVTVAGDVRGAVDAVLDRWGRIDVLVNNAGGFPRIRRTEEIPDEEWDWILRFNLTSAFLCAKAVLPAMRRQGRGRIVNLSSVVGRGGGPLVTSHYATAKAGILGFTRHLAREVAGDGITVNAVAPGNVATERWHGLRSEEQKREIAAGVPVGRVSDPAEIAEAVLFLASDQAGYITGATLDVNGGIAMV